MRNKLKARLPKINFILGGLLFLLSSLSFFGDDQVTQATIFLILGLINLALFRFQHRYPAWINILVLGLNAIGAVVVALDYQSKGTSGLHLAWWLVAGLYAVSVVVQLRKYWQTSQHTSN